MSRKQACIAFVLAVLVAQAACLSSASLPTPSSGAATLLALTTTPGSALPTATVRPTITRTATLPSAGAAQPTATIPGELMPATPGLVLEPPLVQPGTPMPRPAELIDSSNLETLKPLMVFGGGKILDIRFSADGSRLGVVTTANRLLFDAGTLAAIPYSDLAWEAAFGPQPGELSAEQLIDGIYIVQAESNELLSRLDGAEMLPEVFSPSYELAAVFISAEQIGVWETTNGELLRTLDTRQAPVNLQCADLMDPVFSPDGVFLAAGCRQSGQGYIWRIQDAVLVQVLETEASRLGGLAFSGDARWLSAVLPANEIRLWRVRDGALQRFFRDASGSRRTAVGKSIFSPDGYYLVGGFINGELLVWRLSDGRLLRVLQGPGYFVERPGEGMVISPDGSRLIYSSWNQVIVRSTEDGRVLFTIKSETEPEDRQDPAAVTGFIRSLAVSADSRMLAVILDDGSNSVYLYRLADGRLEQQINLPAQPQIVRSALLQDVFAAVSERDVFLFRSNGDFLPVNITTPQSTGDRLECLAISPDGEIIAASRQDSGLQIWEWETGQLITDLGLYPDCALQFSPGGSLLAASSNGALRVYGSQDWGIVYQATGLGPMMAFSPPGSLLLASNPVSQLQAVNLDGTDISWPGLNCPAVLSSLVFHPAGRWFAAAYLDGAIRIFGPG